MLFEILISMTLDVHLKFPCWFGDKESQPNRKLFSKNKSKDQKDQTTNTIHDFMHAIFDWKH